MKKQQIEAIANQMNIQANVISNNLAEVAVYDEDGDIDKQESSKQGTALSEALGWEGFKNGWGGFTVRPIR